MRSSAWWLIAVAWTALVTLCIGWELWWAPLRPGGSWLAVKALPLLAAAPGLWRGRPFAGGVGGAQRGPGGVLYTAQWLSLLVWFYLCEGVVRGLTDPGAVSRLLGWAETALSLLLFAALAVALRGAEPREAR